MTENNWKALFAWGSLIVIVVYAFSMTMGAIEASRLAVPERKQTPTQSASKESSTKKKPATKSSPKAPPSQSNTKQIEVLIKGLNLRSQPWKGNNVVASLDKGMVLDILETLENWYRVKTPDGKSGYIASDEKFVKQL